MGVKNDMRIVKEEVFGPVMTVIKWSSDDQVIRMADATDYGLAMCVLEYRACLPAVTSLDRLLAAVVRARCSVAAGLRACVTFGAKANVFIVARLMPCRCVRHGMDEVGPPGNNNSQTRVVPLRVRTS